MTPVRVLSVCTHNRTRSVLVGGLLTQHFERDGVDGGVRAVGFGDSGLPATTETIRLLASRGVDVRDHRSRQITGEDVIGADLIVTAERMHVIEIAGRWPDAFDKTMTLPELVQRGEGAPRPDQTGITSWLDAMSLGRPHNLDYLDADIDEIADPTGQPPAAWRKCTDQIDDLTARLAKMLA